MISMQRKEGSTNGVDIDIYEREFWGVGERYYWTVCFMLRCKNTKSLGSKIWLVTTAWNYENRKVQITVFRDVR